MSGENFLGMTSVSSQFITESSARVFYEAIAVGDAYHIGAVITASAEL